MEIMPFSTKSFKHKQSPTEIVPKLPARILISAPSGAGKGIITHNLLLNPKLYRCCFSKIYYCSGSAKLDHNLKILTKYCEQELGMKPGECLIDGWDEEAIQSIITKQRDAVKAAKKRGDKQSRASALCRTTTPTTGRRCTIKR